MGHPKTGKQDSEIVQILLGTVSAFLFQMKIQLCLLGVGNWKDPC